MPRDLVSIRWRRWLCRALALPVLCAAACDDGVARRGGDADGGGDAVAPTDAPRGDARVADGASRAEAGADGAAEAGPAPDGAPPATSAAAWIKAHFAGAPQLSGSFSARTQVEAPRLVIDASGTNAKYAFETVDQSAPNQNEVGFVDVTIRDLVSADAYGAGIVTKTPGATLYLARVTIAPAWPLWQSYSATNKDGIVLDGAVAFYAEDLTIERFNADSAIDNKAPVSQLVRLTISGPGHRSIRYWGAGPHYLVDSRIDNPGTVGEGSLVWFKDCGAAELRVYNSRFDGAPTIPAERIGCDSGASPQITYLAADPRSTGELHPMFSAP